MDGVDDEVLERLEYASAVYCHARGCDFEFDADFCMSESGGCGCEGFLNEFDEVVLALGWCFGSCEKEPLVDEGLDAFGGGDDGFCGFGGFRLFDELGVEADGCDRVIDFVSEAGGHLTEGGEAFGVFACAAFFLPADAAIIERAGEVADFVEAVLDWDGLKGCGIEEGDAVGQRFQG